MNGYWRTHKKEITLLPDTTGQYGIIYPYGTIQTLDENDMNKFFYLWAGQDDWEIRINLMNQFLIKNQEKLKKSDPYFYKFIDYAEEAS